MKNILVPVFDVFLTNKCTDFNKKKYELQKRKEKKKNMYPLFIRGDEKYFRK
jgi:hypothetical protein